MWTSLRVINSWGPQSCGGYIFMGFIHPGTLPASHDEDPGLIPYGFGGAKGK